jgi:hypothetical protein
VQKLAGILLVWVRYDVDLLKLLDHLQSLWQREFVSGFKVVLELPGHFFSDCFLAVIYLVHLVCQRVQLGLQFGKGFNVAGFLLIFGLGKVADFLGLLVNDGAETFVLVHDHLELHSYFEVGLGQLFKKIHFHVIVISKVELLSFAQIGTPVISARRTARDGLAYQLLCFGASEA